MGLTLSYVTYPIINLIHFLHLSFSSTWKNIFYTHFSLRIFYFLTCFLITESTFSQHIQLFSALILHECMDFTKLESFPNLNSLDRIVCAYTDTHTHTHMNIFLQQTLAFNKLLPSYGLHPCAFGGQEWESPLGLSKNPDKIWRSISEVSEQNLQSYKHRCSYKESWMNYFKLSVSAEIHGI